MNIPRTSNHGGFTLLEIVAVLIVLAVLAGIAVPRIFDLTNAAKASSLEVMSRSTQSVNSLIIAKVKTGTDVQEVANRADLLDIDIDGDGSYDTRLKWGYLDNTDIQKWLRLSENMVISYSGIDTTYIGYDLDGNGNANNDNCYFRYIQANSSGSQPQYDVFSSACP